MTAENDINDTPEYEIERLIKKTAGKKSISIFRKMKKKTAMNIIFGTTLEISETLKMQSTISKIQRAFPDSPRH